MPVVEPTFDLKPKVNLTNLHSGVWGVLHTMADDDTLKDEHREIMARGRDALDEFITPDILYDIMKDEASDYILDPYNMLVYANIIIEINEEAGKIHDAQ